MEQKKIIAASTTIGVSILTILLLILSHNGSPNIKCTLSMKADLSNNHGCMFCLNSSNGLLGNMYIINSRRVLTNFTLYDSFEIAKAIYFCTRGLHCTQEKLKIDYPDNCPYFVHIHLLKFCFNLKKQLISTNLFDNVTLNTHETRKLLYYLNVFLKLKKKL